MLAQGLLYVPHPTSPHDMHHIHAFTDTPAATHLCLLLSCQVLSLLDRTLQQRIMSVARTLTPTALLVSRTTNQLMACPCCNG